MLRFFKTTQPSVFLAIPLVTLVLWLRAFAIAPIQVDDNGLPLNQWLFGMLYALPVFVQALIAVLLVSAEAIYLNMILNKYEVVFKTSFLPALMYVLLMSFAMPVIFLHRIIIVNVLMIIALNRTFSIFKNDATASPIFDSCFLIAVASLIYFPAVVFLLLFFIALLILRPFHKRDWMIALTGFALPYFFLGVYFFWNDSFQKFSEFIFSKTKLNVFEPGFIIQNPFLILLSFLLVLLVLSIAKLRINFYKNSIRTRGNQQIVIFYFIIATLSSLMLRGIPMVHFTLLAIPLSVFFGYYFVSLTKKLWLVEFALWVMMGLVVWNQV
jgi:hypothetical protein